MLKKALELAEENNQMLHAMKRAMFWGRVARIIYWVIIVGGAIGAYYYLQPYIDGAVNAYGSVKGDLQNFGGLFR
jgi:hypothetical protein